MTLFLVYRSDITDLQEIAKKYLHTNELEFLEALSNENRKNEYLSGRIVVKKLVLSTYKNILSTDVETKYTAQRKPYLKIRSIKTPLSISISHTDTIAIASGVSSSNIGIDCEKNKIISKKLENYFITSEEKKVVDTIKKDNLNYSLVVWTQKEATLKAIGVGLNKTLGSVSLTSYKNTMTTLTYKSNKQLLKYYGKIICYKDHLISCVTTEEKTLEKFSIQEVKI